MSARLSIEDIYPLSPLQQGMLFNTLFARHSGVYIHQYDCTLEGSLSWPAFLQSWQQVIKRHSILRSAFEWQDLDVPVQIVFRGIEISLQEQDWSELSRQGQAERLEDYLITDRERGFDLSQSPLMRLTLIKLASNAYHFVWTHHHVLLDGWSVFLV